jgi:hypothetical protein
MSATLKRRGRRVLCSAWPGGTYCVPHAALCRTPKRLKENLKLKVFLKLKSGSRKPRVARLFLRLDASECRVGKVREATRIRYDGVVSLYGATTEPVQRLGVLMRRDRVGKFR